MFKLTEEFEPGVVIEAEKRIVTVDLTNYPVLYDALDKGAHEEMRSIKKQARWVLQAYYGTVESASKDGGL